MIKSSPATQKRRRQEAKVIKAVRPLVADRDGFCRLMLHGVGACQGRSEWAHFEEKKRFKTRRMPASDRHTTQGSLMACTRHHTMYDGGKLGLEAMDPTRGCDGPLRVLVNGKVVHEEVERDYWWHVVQRGGG